METMTEECWYVMLLLCLAHLVSYTTQDHRPRDITSYRGWALPHLSTIHKTSPQTCPQDNVMEAIPSAIPSFWVTAVGVKWTKTT